MSIRLASFPPIQCAVCFQQSPDWRYVDYDAAADRGYVIADGRRFTMDDIVICEHCTRVGGEQIGMLSEAESTSLRAENTKLKKTADEAKKEAERQQEYAARLEGVFDHRPQRIPINHRIKPRERVA